MINKKTAKIKWCFLINNASFLSEFFGKLAGEIIKQGNDCLVVWNSKIAEYGKKKFFPKEARFISKIDWCIKNYNSDKKDFGDLSWRELFTIYDRLNLKFNYEKSLGTVNQLYQFFDYILEKEKPDIIISEIPSGLFHEVAYYFCKKNNTPHLGLGGSRFNNRIDVYDLEFTCSKYEKSFKEINGSNISKKEKRFAQNFIEKFISHRQPLSYMGLAKIYFSQFGIVKHYFERIKEVGPSLLQYLKKRKYFKNFDYESESILKKVLLAPLRMEKRQFRILSQKKIFSKTNNQDENFFFFPLHFQPESSILVYAPYYCDQLNTVRNIALSLPFPYKLYVKEHPIAIGTRPKEFYEKLKNIPNVVLISSYEDVKNLVKNLSGVITLTSTFGMEAALAGKPVYVFGNVFYSYHPLCRIVKNFEELKEKIKEDLKRKPETLNLEEINLRFIISYLRNNIPGNMFVGEGKNNTNDYKLIYQNLKKMLKEEKNE